MKTNFGRCTDNCVTEDAEIYIPLPGHTDRQMTMFANATARLAVRIAAAAKLMRTGQPVIG
jgi:hypothetical protein